jgi:hypothetical protein
MPAPTFVSETESVWTVMAISTATRDSAAIAVVNGDLLVACMGSEDTSTNGTLTASTLSGSTSAWTKVQEVTVTGNTGVALAWATATATGNVTVRLTRSLTTSARSLGLNVLVFRNHGGAGASNKTNASGAPTLNLLTTAANSAIAVISGDWSAQDGTTRTWRTGAGTLTEVTYYRDSAAYAMYAGYHADAGAIGTYAVGLSAPGTQTYSIAALEIKGTAGAGTPQPSPWIYSTAVRRAATF